MPKVFVLDIVERACCSSEKSCSTGFRSSFYELVIVQLQFLLNLIEFYYRLLWVLFEFRVNLGGRYLSIIWLDFTYQSCKWIDDIIKCKSIKEILSKIKQSMNIPNNFKLQDLSQAFYDSIFTMRYNHTCKIDDRFAKKRETLEMRMFRYENKS